MKQQASAYFQDVLDKRLSRRHFIRSATAVAVGSSLTACGVNTTDKKATTAPLDGFVEVAQGLDTQFTVPDGYDFQVLVRWGDPILSHGTAFDPFKQTEASQLAQFGFNNDYIGYFPLPYGSENPDHGLLVVNHEYTRAKLMHPGSPNDETLNKALTDVDIAAHGLSVVEVKKQPNQQWQVLQDSKLNRRITPQTEMKMTGDGAGHSRLRTAMSQDGIKTFGTYGNCAGGFTPWGTILTAEENVDGYFGGEVDGHPEEENYRRFGVSGKSRKSWGKHYDRWDINKEPQELMHAGWIVEFDPYDPESVPMKRTNIGRYKHEACTVHVNDNGHVVAYSGDDARFEYVYKFVSRDKYQPEPTAEARKANMSLLEFGTLYVARFNDDGTLNWLPLVFGQSGLDKSNGFNSQADICFDTRKAADIVGATPMDRPEDVEVNPVNGRVYLMLTNNTKRKADQLDKVNPRANNKAGQIVEFTAPNGDHTAETFNWDMFLLAGNPKDTITNYHPDTTENGWLACPDNCAFDLKGNVWVGTDGAEYHGVADGLWMIPAEGENRGLAKRFLRSPIGAELTGPCFSPDNKTLFCSVQHPAGGSSFDDPDTRWPDFQANMPARSAVVAVFKKDGGVIGS